MVKTIVSYTIAKGSIPFIGIIVINISCTNKKFIIYILIKFLLFTIIILKFIIKKYNNLLDLNKFYLN